MSPIFLASASPRRSQLLAQIGVAHRVSPVDIDEARLGKESPAEYVSRLAVAKAKALWERLPQLDRLPVLGSDTTVALGHDIFGKPLGRDDGIAMLQALSGKTHHVYTAVALYSSDPASGRNAGGDSAECDMRLSISQVTFDSLSLDECAAYWDTGEPQGKAGGYAVQGLAAAFITHIAGSYSGIMGLPLFETVELLRKVGFAFGASGTALK